MTFHVPSWLLQPPDHRSLSDKQTNMHTSVRLCPFRSNLEETIQWAVVSLLLQKNRINQELFIRTYKYICKNDFHLLLNRKPEALTHLSCRCSSFPTEMCPSECLRKQIHLLAVCKDNTRAPSEAITQRLSAKLTVAFDKITFT